MCSRAEGTQSTGLGHVDRVCGAGVPGSLLTAARDPNVRLGQEDVGSSVETVSPNIEHEDLDGDPQRHPSRDVEALAENLEEDVVVVVQDLRETGEEEQSEEGEQEGPASAPP